MRDIYRKAGSDTSIVALFVITGANVASVISGLI
jgi:hypothetical protein